MTVQLYEGCWGVTRGGEKRGPIITVRPEQAVGEVRYIFFRVTGLQTYWTKSGVANFESDSRDDIIAVFATGAEADAYLAGEPAVNAPSFTFAPAPKPVTWPDGVTKMTIGPHQITIDAETGVIQVVWHGSVGSTPAQARQLAALLLAAADKVEAGNG